MIALTSEVGQWLNLYQSTPGRTIFAAEETEAKIKDDAERATIAPKAAAARAAAAAQIDFETNWLQNRGIRPTRPEAPKIDAPADVLITSIYEPAAKAAQVLVPDAGGEPPDEEDEALQKWAAKFVEDHFIQGAVTITSRPYEDQLALMIRLDTALQARKNRVPVDTLGLRPYARRLTKIIPTYRAALTKIGVRVVSFEEVVEARKATHEALAQLVVAILNLPEPAARTRLLGPIQYQQRLIAQAHTEKRALRDVHPKTGVEVDTPVLERPENPPADPA